MRGAGLGDAPRTLVADLAKIKSGDVVLPTVTRDGCGAVYTVLAVGDQPPCRYADAHRQTQRIHTKGVEAGR